LLEIVFDCRVNFEEAVADYNHHFFFSEVYHFSFLEVFVFLEVEYSSTLMGL
jgi:hypothetical protein